MTTQLTTLALVETTVVLPEADIGFFVCLILELENGGLRLLAIGRLQTYILDFGLFCTVWTMSD